MYTSSLDTLYYGLKIHGHISVECCYLHVLIIAVYTLNLHYM
jgi:hypothetical protein